MDRIHRLDQRRPVQAIKFVIEDSIESRIVELQEKKSAMVDATLSTDDSVRAFPQQLWVISRNGDITAGYGPTYARRCTSYSP
jgi:DNA repair protein RAD16